MLLKNMTLFALEGKKITNIGFGSDQKLTLTMDDGWIFKIQEGSASRESGTALYPSLYTKEASKLYATELFLVDVHSSALTEITTPEKGPKQINIPLLKMADEREKEGLPEWVDKDSPTWIPAKFSLQLEVTGEVGELSLTVESDLSASKELSIAINQTAKIASSVFSNRADIESIANNASNNLDYYEAAQNQFADDITSREALLFNKKISETVALHNLDGSYIGGKELDVNYNFNLLDFASKDYDGVSIEHIQGSKDLYQLASDMGAAEGYVDQQVRAGHAAMFLLKDNVNIEYSVVKVQSLSDAHILLENHHGVDGAKPSEKMELASQRLIDDMTNRLIQQNGKESEFTIGTSI